MEAWAKQIAVVCGGVVKSQPGSVLKAGHGDRSQGFHSGAFSAAERHLQSNPDMMQRNPEPGASLEGIKTGASAGVVRQQQQKAGVLER